MIQLTGNAQVGMGHDLYDFLFRNHIPFQWIDSLNDPCVCEFPNGQRIENPQVGDILAHLGWHQRPSQELYDVCIYGAGPAGLSAAMYAGSSGLRTLLIERWACGGQASSSPKIENYLGFPKGISGQELTARAIGQVKKFGVELIIGHKGELGKLDNGSLINARTSIIATGMDYRRLPAENERQFRNFGLYYGAGATESRDQLYEPVVVIGAGNSGAQAALRLAKRVNKVLMVIREQNIVSSVSAYWVEKIRNMRNIRIMGESQVVMLMGDKMLSGIMVQKKEDKPFFIKTQSVFVCIGGYPRTEWVPSSVQRDEKDYIRTGTQGMGSLETSLPGVFACGDVRSESFKRYAIAVGEGSLAAAQAWNFLHQ